jgi:uncharacterized membrane protein (DUF4010 family)
MDGTFESLGISLGLGLLVGLQRQHSDSRIAGIRTFPLITLFGTLCGLLAQPYGGWVIAGGLLALVISLGVANLIALRSEALEPGQTTEIAALLMFVLGAYLPAGDKTVAVAVGGLAAVLLYLKEPLHRFVERIGEHDLRAIMQFVVIALIILPLLPDRTYGPYDVLNPYEIWRMVVLIVGIGLAGYAAYKAFGERAGALLGGVLGGLISSTATTVSYARRTRAAPDAAALAMLVIMIASSIAFARIIVEVSVVAPQLLGQIAPPLGAMLALMLALSAGAYLLGRGQHDQMPAQGNPAELKSALVFGAIYALVIVGVAAAKDLFGNSGLYLVALISGLTDVDAITLSTANLARTQRLDAANAWRIILIAALANLAFKGALVALLGHRRLLARAGALFGIALAGGLAILWLWA